MPRTNDEMGVTISILDRLIDYEPGLSQEAERSRLKSVRQLKDSVRRDLEWLLNTRQVVDEEALQLKETSKSVATFGLPDFTNLSAHKLDDQREIRRQIEQAISFFEPRLESVVVVFQASNSSDRLMHFRINAHLKMDPEPEPVSFDTVVQIGNGQYVVREQ